MPHLHVALDGSFYGAHIHTSQAGPEMDATLSSGGIPIHGWHWAGSSTAKGDTSDLLRTQCALLCRPARTARSSSSSRTAVVAAADAFHFHDSGEVPGSKLMFRSVRRSSSIVGPGRRPRALTSCKLLAHCPVSGTECLLYTALCRHTDRLDLPRHVGRTIASGRSVAGPNLGPATAKAISTSTEKHGSHGRRVSAAGLESRQERAGASGEDVQDTTLRQQVLSVICRIGGGHRPCSLTPTRQKQSKILAVRDSVGSGRGGGWGSARLEFQLAAVSTLDSRRTCPSHAKSGHARGYPACRKPPRWHNLELVVQPVMILSCRNRSRHGANGTSHVWEEPAERSPPAIAPATFGSLLAPPVRTPGWG